MFAAGALGPEHGDPASGDDGADARRHGERVELYARESLPQQVQGRLEQAVRHQAAGPDHRQGH